MFGNRAKPWARGVALLFAALVASCSPLGQSQLPDVTGIGEPWTRVDETGTREVTLFYYYSDSCRYCQRARPFVDELAATYSWLEVAAFEVSGNRENLRQYEEMVRMVGGEGRGVPAFLFCGQLLRGFGSADTSGEALRRLLEDCYHQLEGPDAE
jgi:hypothetical protein